MYDPTITYESGHFREILTEPTDAHTLKAKVKVTSVLAKEKKIYADKERIEAARQAVIEEAQRRETDPTRSQVRTSEIKITPTNPQTLKQTEKIQTTFRLNEALSQSGSTLPKNIKVR